MYSVSYSTGYHDGSVYTTNNLDALNISIHKTQIGLSILDFAM